MNLNVAVAISNKGAKEVEESMRRVDATLSDSNGREYLQGLREVLDSDVAQAMLVRDETRPPRGLGWPSEDARERNGAIADRDGWICGLCGHAIVKAGGDPKWKLHVDHKIPKARGGSDDDSNLQAAHAHCNMLKGTRLNVRVVHTRGGSFAAPANHVVGFRYVGPQGAKVT